MLAQALVVAVFARLQPYAGAMRWLPDAAWMIRGRVLPPDRSPQNSAEGATVEPEPPWTFRGCTAKANSC